jgi:hypothetical protein
MPFRPRRARAHLTNSPPECALPYLCPSWVERVAPPRPTGLTYWGQIHRRPPDFVWFSEARQLGVTALWVGLGLWFLE